MRMRVEATSWPIEEDQINTSLVPAAVFAWPNRERSRTEASVDVTSSKSVFSRIRARWTAYRDARRLRQEGARLHDMNDAMLKDIGISRFEIFHSIRRGR